MLFAQWQEKFTGTFNHIDVLGLGKFEQNGKPITAELPKRSYPANTNIPKITGGGDDPLASSDPKG
jgi:hypothetical protein